MQAQITPCAVQGCERIGQLRRGLCNAHYKRLILKGDVGPVGVQPKRVGSCSVDECTETARGRGLCRLHYSRNRVNGTPYLQPRLTPAERIVKGSQREPSGCFVWMGARDPNGYGRMSYMTKPHLVHRVKWEIENGNIPANMAVCHRCDNPPCHEITHLFLGTQSENLKDMIAKGRGHPWGHMHPKAQA